MLEFTERKELSPIKRILSYSKHGSSIYFKLSGKSGSGKTELIKKAVEKIVKSDTLFIYIDITADEFQSTSFFSTLLETVYLPLKHHYNTITNIPDNLALSKYTKKIFKTHSGFEKIFSTLTIPVSAIPEAGGPLSLIMDKWLIERANTIDSLLLTYFKYIIKKARINLIVDNYQFLPSSIKHVLETEINELNFGFTFVVIERIREAPTHEKSFCAAFRHEYLDLDYMSYEQYQILVEKQNIGIDNSKIKKMWEVTKGNLKDTEIILNEVRINPGYNIINNKIAIQNLDSIQRSILLIAAVFPAGMKEDFVIQFIRYILKENEENKIKKAIVNLIDLGYIYINSSAHDTIKPTHETVINNVKEAVDLHDFVGFCASLSDSLEELVEYYHGTKDYSYLLHCWVGINSAETLRKKTGFVQELISIKFKENSYYYIDTIAMSIADIIIYLNETCIEKILISFQRVSDFHNGINMLNTLRHADKMLYNSFQIYYIKFLIQTYEFEEALKALESFPASSLRLLCQTNALQHLGWDDQVENLIRTELPKCPHDENYYVILRNTAHFFEYEKAKENLLASMDYFGKNKYTAFAIATIQNNLSVINIWSGRYDKAEEFLTLAIKTLERLNSNEVFETYCNKSILHFMQHEYPDALEFAKKALEHCPRTLTLDIIMLKINIIIIELCFHTCSVETAFNNLKILYDEYPTIEDPWYEFQLLFNKNQLANLIHQDSQSLGAIHKRYLADYNDGKTKFYILKQVDINNAQIELCLGLSPNWRY